MSSFPEKMHPQPQKPVASVIILVKNGMPDIERCLRSVFDQITEWPFEVIVIDSGSTDGTLVAVRQFPTRLIEIPPDEFSHGETRNLGARESRAERLVYLVADAIPLDETWLSALVDAVEGEGVGAAYSRQIPRPEHNLIIRRSLESWPTFSKRRAVKEIPQHRKSMLSPEERYELALYDDVSSCMRKDLWEEFPYKNVYCEDIDWSNRILEAGYKVVYEPASVVVHSHQRPAIFELRRAYVFNRQLHLTLGIDPMPTFIVALRHWSWSTLQSWRWVLKSDESIPEKLRLILWSPAFAARLLGVFLGIRSVQWLPRHRSLGWIDRLISTGVN